MTTLDAIIDNLPAGTDRYILRCLSFHKGAENAIGRYDLLKVLEQHGIHITEREMRGAINNLRKQGNLICSAGGTQGGYYSPASPLELQEYFDRELHPRAMDLLEQEKAMKDAAEKVWGRFSPDMQMRF